MSAAQRHIDAFLEMLGAERGAAANTIDAYRRDLGELLAPICSTRDTELLAPQPADVSGWLTAASVAGLGAASRAARPLRRAPALQVPPRRRSRRRRSDARPRGPAQAAPAPQDAQRRRGRPAPRRRRAPHRSGRRRPSGCAPCVSTASSRCSTRPACASASSSPCRASVLAGDARMLTIKGKGGRERLVPLNAAARTALDRYLAATHQARAPITDQMAVPFQERPRPSDPPAASPRT